ncbi:hypothetical protein CARUB_v10019109mg [Capsella rubella]|uniref:F-box domain-containing protein n=1 Tax=Capsella rubella TaxID=81985 RepID=R0FSD6_9BRAS|nr:hypothetical protein CARUB_v10019109mg [Capsella rubella]
MRNIDFILDLPADLVENIVNKLPLKSLLRFQVTCKGWGTLFKENRFIYAHLESSHKYPSFLHARDSSKIWMLENFDPSPLYFKLFDFRGEHIRGMSACDGLIFFNTFSRKIATWNCNLEVTGWLANREYMSINDWYSLGRTRDMIYKVLRFNIFDRYDDDDCVDYTPEAEVYNVSSRRWKSVEMAETWNLYRHKFFVVSLRGNSFRLAYWFESNEDESTAGLSCFQGNKISLLYQKLREYTELWVTNRVRDEDQVSAWKKLFIITIAHPLIDHPSTYFANLNNITIFSEEVTADDDDVHINLMKISQSGVEQTEVQRYKHSHSCAPSKSCVYFQSLVPVPVEFDFNKQI